MSNNIQLFEDKREAKREVSDFKEKGLSVQNIAYLFQNPDKQIC